MCPVRLSRSRLFPFVDDEVFYFSLREDERPGGARGKGSLHVVDVDPEMVILG